MIKEYYYRNGFGEYDGTDKINLCLGFFDGMHKGHQFLIRKAKQLNIKTGVVTFDGKLKELTNSHKDGGELTSVSDRFELLNDLGVDYLFVIQFDNDLMNMSAEDFIVQVLVPLNINAIYVGSDFTFGKNAVGNVALLKKYFDVEIVDFLYDNGKKISSRDIIRLIRSGLIKEADILLGRPYLIKGKVVHGLANGKDLIGYPTANINIQYDYVLPSNGVYVTYINVNNKKYLSMTNIGHHPTIDKLKRVSIESYILDFSADIYGSEVVLEFVDRIRDEKRFASVDLLRKQLDKDKTFIQNNYKLM